MKKQNQFSSWNVPDSRLFWQKRKWNRKKSVQIIPPTLRFPLENVLQAVEIVVILFQLSCYFNQSKAKHSERRERIERTTVKLVRENNTLNTYMSSNVGLLRLVRHTHMHARSPLYMPIPIQTHAHTASQPICTHVCRRRRRRCCLYSNSLCINVLASICVYCQYFSYFCVDLHQFHWFHGTVLIRFSSVQKAFFSIFFFECGHWTQTEHTQHVIVIHTFNSPNAKKHIDQMLQVWTSVLCSILLMTTTHYMYYIFEWVERQRVDNFIFH